MEGAECLGLVVQEFHSAGEQVCPANVLFLQIAPERWLRFFLDAGVFFWRQVPEVVGISDAEAAPGCRYPLVTLAATGLVGSRVETATFHEVSRNGPARVILHFNTGATLALVNESDASSVELTPPVAPGQSNASA